MTAAGRHHVGRLTVVTAAAGRHHHLIRLAGLALIAAAVAVIAVVTIRGLIRRGRRSRARQALAAGADEAPGAEAPRAEAPPAEAPAAEAPAAELPATQAGAVAVAVRHLSKTYQMGNVTVRALDDVSLEIQTGAMVCILGRSGSGKSTLLRQLGLLDLPSRGRIWLNGEEVTRLPESRRARLRLRGLGYVFQEYALLPELTAAENVYLPAMMAGQAGRRCRDRAAELLDLVELGQRARHRPREMSGGEQQRVAIARALVNEPTIIFADEPTANLDTTSARTVMESLAKLNQALGVTVVFVSHEPDDARYATALVHLADGKITAEQQPAERVTHTQIGAGTQLDGGQS